MMHRTTDERSCTPYAQAAATFDLRDAAGLLDGSLTDGLNACHECCDRHCTGPQGGADRIALRWIATDGHLALVSFAQLRSLSIRAAAMLRRAGIGPGDVVSGLLPRTPILLAVVLGAWRLGAVYQPLFTAFGPKAITHRLTLSHARLIVTDTDNRAKLDGIATCPPVATVAATGTACRDGDIDVLAALAAPVDEIAPVLRHGDDLMLMMSTSGTTGLAKGVPVPLRALMAFGLYMRDAVGLRPDDVFWNIADPGWAYGLYYGIAGPLLLGCATTLFEAGFSPEALCETVRRLGITNLAGSPTAFRALMAAPEPVWAPIAGRLRAISSAGEPLNPDAMSWFRDRLGVPILDHYGQTETGMTVNNHHRLDHPVRAGSAGFPLPGYRIAVLDPDGQELGPNQPGVLAIDIARSPLLFFTGYHTEDATRGDGYYRTGDTVELEPDGSVSFIGREDDLITSSGYRIGPFDVESALLEHPAVIDCAVVGVPDPVRTEIVKAFVVLAAGFEGTPALAEELRLHVRSRMSAHAYPRAIAFVDGLPRTPSGKVQRFLLRRAEIDQPRNSGDPCR